MPCHKPQIEFEKKVKSMCKRGLQTAEAMLQNTNRIRKENQAFCTTALPTAEAMLQDTNRIRKENQNLCTIGLLKPWCKTQIELEKKVKLCVYEECQQLKPCCKTNGIVKRKSSYMYISIANLRNNVTRPKLNWKGKSSYVLNRIANS